MTPQLEELRRTRAHIDALQHAIDEAQRQQQLAQARARRARLEQEAARQLYLRSILEARESGATYRAIAEALGVSVQRAQQLVRRAEADAGLERDRHFPSPGGPDAEATSG
jgi:FixJ family two-component response regulator